MFHGFTYVLFTRVRKYSLLDVQDLVGQNFGNRPLLSASSSVLPFQNDGNFPSVRPSPYFALSTRFRKRWTQDPASPRGDTALIAILAMGLAVGTGLALATTQATSKVLFGLDARDPGTLLLAAVLLSMVTLIASYLPAHRAARLDPLEALREL